MQLQGFDPGAPQEGMKLLFGYLDRVDARLARAQEEPLLWLESRLYFNGYQNLPEARARLDEALARLASAGALRGRPALAQA